MPVNTSITFRKGSSSQWSSTNPVLASGEPGYDLTNNILKIGDGVSAWNSLSNHSHSSSDISNFNSSVSGLLPITSIVAGTGIFVSSSSGTYTINTTIDAVAEAGSLVTTVFNKTANTINKGSVVYINGGQGDQPTIQLAIGANEGGSSKTYGIVQNNIPSMSLGKVIVAGALTSFNTDQFNPTAPAGNVNGVTLWLSPSISGDMTTTKPSAPYHMVSVGTIVRTHQNEGVIEVKIQNGFELEELHNVAISGVNHGQFLQYNSASGLWVPSSSGNFSTLQVNGTGVSVNGHTHTSSDITNFNSSVSGLLPSNIVTGVGTSGYYTKWNGSNSVTSGIIFDNGTNVGIGTTTPSGQLHVVGTGIVSSRLGVGTTSPQYALDVVGSGNFLNGLAISGVPLAEIIDDEVAGLLVAGSGISLSYNDSANTLTVDTNVSTSLIASSGISLDYNISTDELSIRANNNVINSSNLYLWSNFR